MRKTGKKGLFDGFFFVLFMQVHAAEPVFSRWKLSTHWSKTAHVTIELRSRHRINSRLTRFVSGKANECRWQHRRYQVDPWSRRREVARNVLRSSPQPEKKVYFFTSERDREFVVGFVHTRGQMFLYQTPGRRPPTYHRPCCEHWPEGGSEPLTSAPRSEFMTQSFVLWIDICRGLGISPLRI